MFQHITCSNENLLASAKGVMLPSIPWELRKLAVMMIVRANTGKANLSQRANHAFVSPLGTFLSIAGLVM
jgi:hypothetical protein